MSAKSMLGAMPALAAALVLTTGCGRSAGEAVRIGVIIPCRGTQSALASPALAGAELPFVQRGARLEGAKPSDGISSTKIAGKTVGLVVGCDSSESPSTTIDAVRRLVELDGVKAVVTPFDSPDGLVVKAYAREHPDVAFLPSSTEQSLTLKDPLPNIFRFQLDQPQLLAGLGSYAYRTLGWRKASIISDQTLGLSGWGGDTAGIAAEFCSLGGTIIKLLPARPDGAVPALVPAGVDGVFLASEAQAQPMQQFILQWGNYRNPDIGRQLLLSSSALRDAVAAGLVGLVGESEAPFAATPAYTHYLADYHRAFPGVPSGGVDVRLYTETEAIVEALERAHGDVSHGERRLQATLRLLPLDAPTGTRWLDRRQQAVGPMYLGRSELDAHGTPVVRQIRVIRNVEQTFNGYFSPATPPPSQTQPICRKGHVPAWAR
jgi:branched-chain amino acid transport system substrate-binding protein